MQPMAMDFQPPPMPQNLTAQQPFAPKVVAFSGVKPDTDRAIISSLCGEYGLVAYVDFRFGETTGMIRFRSTLGARAALAALSTGGARVG